MDESQDCPKIPREPIDKFTNITWRYFDVRSFRSKRYLENFLSALLSRFVSKPTLNSRTQRVLEGVEMSMSGRRSSPVTREGEKYCGRST